MATGKIFVGFARTRRSKLHANTGAAATINAISIAECPFTRVGKFFLKQLRSAMVNPRAHFNRSQINAFHQFTINPINRGLNRRRPTRPLLRKTGLGENFLELCQKGRDFHLRPTVLNFRHPTGQDFTKTSNIQLQRQVGALRLIPGSVQLRQQFPLQTAGNPSGVQHRLQLFGIPTAKADFAGHVQLCQTPEQRDQIQGVIPPHCQLTNPA